MPSEEFSGRYLGILDARSIHIATGGSILSMSKVPLKVDAVIAVCPVGPVSGTGLDPKGHQWLPT